MDIVNCTLTGEPFYCHEGLEHGQIPNRVCCGWEAITRNSKSGNKLATGSDGATVLDAKRKGER